MSAERRRPPLPAGNFYLVTIVSALDPEEYGINIADVLT
jgi:hypothetical protein